jgi:Uncharacterized protein conserved in bacteria (DUF2125)
MGRTRIVAVTIVVALAVAAYGAWWLYAAGRLHRGIDDWVEARRALGWQIELDDIAVQGFPLRLQAVARRFAVGRDLPLRWRWIGPRLAASLPPWGGHVVAVSFPGAHEIEVDTHDGPKHIALATDQADGTVEIGDDGRIVLVTAELGATRANLPDLGEAKLARLALTIAASPLPTAPAQNDPRAAEAGRLALNATDIDLPARAAALGPRIGRAEVAVTLRGAIPTARTEPALRTWRDAGGTVELERLRLHWGEFQLESEGTAALDAALQPQGALTARAWGVGAAIDALVVGGGVRPREGATAKVVLHTMAKPRTAQGIPPEVELPLTVQDRRLFLGPVPIARFPVVIWP